MSTPKLSRAESKERTRQRLIDAAITVLGDEGLQAMSTRKLARMAGISQPSFYVHFDDMDALVRAAGEEAADRIRRWLRRWREVEDRGTEPTQLPRLVQAATAQPAFIKLLMKHRRDDTSPLGQVSARFFAGLRDDLRLEIERQAAAADRLPDMELYLDIVGGLALSVLEGVVDGRYRDDEAALRAIGVASRGAFTALTQDYALRRRAREN